MADLKKIAQLQESYQRAKENHVRIKTQLESLEARKAQVIESIKAEGVDPEKLDTVIADLETQITTESDKIQGLLARVER
jgi:septal ring factor EnvC (AmiA/AmiB activator)